MSGDMLLALILSHSKVILKQVMVNNLCNLLLSEDTLQVSSMLSLASSKETQLMEHRLSARMLTLTVNKLLLSKIHMAIILTVRTWGTMAFQTISMEDVKLV